jgi:hypothetical protein
MNKREFYKLFKPAFAKAYSKANIRSGFEYTSLHPFVPSKVLEQLSTQQTQQISRPLTANSKSQPAASPSNWQKLNQLLTQVVRDGNHPNSQQVIQQIHQL